MRRAAALALAWPSFVSRCHGKRGEPSQPQLPLNTGLSHASSRLFPPPAFENSRKPKHFHLRFWLPRFWLLRLPKPRWQLHRHRGGKRSSQLAAVPAVPNQKGAREQNRVISPSRCYADYSLVFKSFTKVAPHAHLSNGMPKTEVATRSSVGKPVSRCCVPGSPFR